jgi:hypothetical protein
MPPVSLGELRGFVDQTGKVVTGWAQYADAPEHPVPLDVYAGALRLGRVLANLYREDVRAAGLGSGNHGFEFHVPADASGEITVRSCDQRVTLETAATPVVQKTRARHKKRAV